MRQRRGARPGGRERAREEETRQARTSAVRRVSRLRQVTESGDLEEELRRREQELRDLNATLEQLVEERTRDLRSAIAGLQESERSFARLVGSVTDYAIFMLDAEGRVASWNVGAERIKGYRRDEILGQHFSRFYTPEDVAAGVPGRALATAASAGRFEAEGWRVRKSGERFWASVVIDAIYEDGRVIGFAKVTRDISERREAQERLLQAQKMEAVGQLTGGIAHDFNNLLGAILPSLELARSRISDERALRYLDNAAHAARRGAALTQRLLSFARQQPLEACPVDLNALIERLGEMLPGAVGPTVSLRTKLDPRAGVGVTDPGQLELAILNLAINGRDAMPNGGVLTISTRRAAPDSASRLGLEPGSYVVVGVADTGLGMSAATLARAFEPFFSTKPAGHGSGLGLSMVQMFARNSGGVAAIESREGAGTLVEIYLLGHGGGVSDLTTAPDKAEVAPTARARILVVDDDDAVRSATFELAQALGHEAETTSSAADALELLKGPRRYDLVIVDLVMPGMNGLELAEQVRAIAPQMRMLFVTGYADTALLAKLPADRVLRKPFRLSDLAAKLTLALALA